jgi:transcriptional regulator with XRE-family HTH domain
MRENITVVMSPKRRVSATIRRLRVRQHLTQAELAKRVKVTQGYISQLEAGTKKALGGRVAVRLAGALGMPVTELLE